MAELYLIRHGQASFGADDYDKLSDIGHAQSQALGQALAEIGVRPEACFMGDLRRHRETLKGIEKGMGLKLPAPEIHTGLNEFDFTALLNAKYRNGDAPLNMHTDRRTHFKILKETVREWQNDQIIDPPEPWSAFAARIEAARQAIVGKKATSVLAVSSGGAISQMIAAALNTPVREQINLQLQIKNCSVHKFIFTERAFYLHSFNEIPHVRQDGDPLLTYS